MRGRFPHLCRAKADRVQQDIGIVQKCFVREADNGETRLGEAMVAQGVFGLAEAMDAAVQLDDQLEVETEEVGDIAGDRGLTPEFPAFEAAIAQQGPEAGLGWRGVGSETTGAARSVWRLMHKA